MHTKIIGPLLEGRSDPCSWKLNWSGLRDIGWAFDLSTKVFVIEDAIRCILMIYYVYDFDRALYIPCEAV